MRLVLASHSAAAGGGAELALLELAESLRGQGVDVHSVLPWDGPLRARLEAVGVETSLERRLRGWVRPAGEPLRRPARHAAAHAVAVRGLVRTLRRVRPDAVVTNTLTIPAAALAARALRLPHLWFAHEFGVRDHGFAFDLGYERSLRLVDRLSARVLVNSEAVREEMSRCIDPTKLRLVQYAVRVPDGACRPLGAPDGYRLVLVGAKSPTKGQEEAIRALALLRAAGEPASLRLVGGGDPAYAPALAELARELGVGDDVALVDETRDVFEHLAWADVALVCSRAEAFGRVTVEAMKAGRPVIGARSGGTAELIRDGWNGLLYAPGDPIDLAAKIRLLRARPELAARLAGTAGAWATERFTGERYTRDFLAAVAEAVGG